MTVVDSKPVEVLGHHLSVVNHVFPKPGIIILRTVSVEVDVAYRTLAISQLDAISPYDDFPAKICTALRSCKVFEGVICPDPPIIRNCQRSFWMLQSSLTMWKSSKQSLYERRSIVSQALISMYCSVISPFFKSIRTYLTLLKIF